MKKGGKRQFAKIIMIVIQFLMLSFFIKLTGNGIRELSMSFGVFMILSFSKNMYSFKSYLFWEELKRQLRLHVEVTGVMMLLSIVEGDMKDLLIYPVMMGLYMLFNIALLRWIRRAFEGSLQKRLLIVGTGRTAKHLAETVEQNRFTMYKLIGFVDARGIMERYSGMKLNIEVPEDEVLCTYKELEDLLEKNQIDEVIIAKPKASAKEMKKIIEGIEGRVKKIKFIPELNSTFTFNSKVEDYDGMLLISSTGGEITPMQLKIKRGIDILAGLAGMCLLGVLQVVYGRKIKRDGGPSLFSHSRVGIGLAGFKMHKFRSMYINAEERLEKMLAEDEAVREEFYTNFKLKDDPRVTPVGDFLRRTSLDEFPQFINVLKGEMSLIGPRPVVQKEVDMYYGDEVGKKVFKVKPGITGMWQAHGRSDVENYDERIALDLYYIRNWSLWLDIVILIKTVKNVVQKKGAY